MSLPRKTAVVLPVVPLVVTLEVLVPDFECYCTKANRVVVRYGRFLAVVNAQSMGSVFQKPHSRLRHSLLQLFVGIYADCRRHYRRNSEMLMILASVYNG